MYVFINVYPEYITSIPINAAKYVFVYQCISAVYYKYSHQYSEVCTCLSVYICSMYKYVTSIYSNAANYVPVYKCISAVCYKYSHQYS